MTEGLKEFLGMMIDESRTESMPLHSRYLVESHYKKEKETIQESMARAAKCWSSNPAHAQRLYDYASKGWFMWASPSYSNSVYEGEKVKNMPISCFESDTLVKTSEGMKRIADIKVGDLVLTRSGSYQKVLNTKESRSTDCYELEFKGERHIVTGNHLVLTEAHGWVRVDELDSKIHQIQSIPRTV